MRTASGDADDSWTETLNAVSTTLESNMRTAVNYAGVFSGWASNLIANLDPTTLLFEDDEDYDYPGRYCRSLPVTHTERILLRPGVATTHPAAGPARTLAQMQATV